MRTHNTKILRIIKAYYEQLYANKLDILKETDKFLETDNLPGLNYDKIEHLKWPIICKEIKLLTKFLPTKKIPGLDGLTGEFYQTLKKIPIFLKFFQQIEEERTAPSLFYEACIILIPKADKDTTRKENYRPISLMNIDVEILNKY